MALSTPFLHSIVPIVKELRAVCIVDLEGHGGHRTQGPPGGHTTSGETRLHIKRPRPSKRNPFVDMAPSYMEADALIGAPSIECMKV
jgi:hypothetical protein